MFFTPTQQGVILRVRLQPNSSCCKILGTFAAPDEDFLKISVISVPEKGKANQELITFLAKKLKLAKSAFEIIGGELDRYKKILINADENIIIPKLEALIDKE